MMSPEERRLRIQRLESAADHFKKEASSLAKQVYDLRVLLSHSEYEVRNLQREIDRLNRELAVARSAPEKLRA